MSRVHKIKSRHQRLEMLKRLREDELTTNVYRELERNSPNKGSMNAGHYERLGAGYCYQKAIDRRKANDS